MIALILALTLQVNNGGAQPRPVEIAPTTPVSAAAPGALPEPLSPGDRLICRSEPVLGTNRRQRVCMTAAQRERLRHDSQQFRESLDNPYNPNVGRRDGGG